MTCPLLCWSSLVWTGWETRTRRVPRNTRSERTPWESLCAAEKERSLCHHARHHEKCSVLDDCCSEQDDCPIYTLQQLYSMSGQCGHHSSRTKEGTRSPHHSPGWSSSFFRLSEIYFERFTTHAGELQQVKIEHFVLSCKSNRFPQDSQRNRKDIRLEE
jgi:hypothetical protein